MEVPSAPEGSYRLDGERIILSLPMVGSLTASGSAVRLVLEVGEGIPERLIVIRSGDGIYHALVDHCTHNDKELYYMHEGEMLRCHSGKSYFDIQGNVMEGPAEVPLRVFPIRQEADQLIIAMKSGGE